MTTVPLIFNYPAMTLVACLAAILLMWLGTFWDKVEHQAWQVPAGICGCAGVGAYLCGGRV